MLSMKTIVWLILFLIISCGQLGKIQEFEFNEDEIIIKDALVKFYIKNNKYIPQGKWLERAKNINKDLTFLDFKFLYLENTNEMLVYGFVGDSLSQIRRNGSSISVDATIKYQDKCKCLYFHKADELEMEEQLRISNLFEAHLLSQLGFNYKKVE